MMMMMVVVWWYVGLIYIASHLPFILFFFFFYMYRRSWRHNKNENESLGVFKDNVRNKSQLVECVVFFSSFSTGKIPEPLAHLIQRWDNSAMKIIFPNVS